MRAASRSVQKARWLQSAWSAPEWSFPWPPASPSQRRRMAAPFRAANIASSSAASSSGTGAAGRPAPPGRPVTVGCCSRGKTSASQASSSSCRASMRSGVPGTRSVVSVR